MAVVLPLSYTDARSCIERHVRARRATPEVQNIPLLDCGGRVLAQAVSADRDYPAVSRSVRDGFAVRAADLPGRLRVIGEVRAGEQSAQSLSRGEAIEIMTGAPLPAGADTVVMVEHVRREDDSIVTERVQDAGTFVNPQGAEAARGTTVLPFGCRIGFAEIAALASIGMAQVPVYALPRVAILATGDEIVPVEAAPSPAQVRNSNVYSLAHQVRAAGGQPELLPVARDQEQETRVLIERGLQADLLLLSGGVSAGKYDLVEAVLASLGAEFYFDRILIQPGQPLVFGRVRERFFFGLPGNPVSTMVTFAALARLALQLLAGEQQPVLPFLSSRLTQPFRHKTGLTRFLPAQLSADGSQLTPVSWTGSSDVFATAKGNAFLIAEAEREQWQAGDAMQVLLR